MFKGLKNRLQDEANKLKDNLQVLNENISSNTSTSSISADLTNDESGTPQQESKSVDEQTAAIEQKLSQEWKARLDQRESEWSQRLSKAQEEMTIKVAECKAQSHQTLEQKDAELCSWISKYHDATKKAEALEQNTKKTNLSATSNAKQIETKLLQENSALAEEIEELRQKLTSMEKEKTEKTTRVEKAETQTSIVALTSPEESNSTEQKREEETLMLRSQVEQLQTDLVVKTESVDRLREELETMSGALNEKSKLISEYEERAINESEMEEKFQKAKQLLRDLNDNKKGLESQLEESRTRTLTIISAYSSEEQARDLTLADALSALEKCTSELSKDAQRHAVENEECLVELRRVKEELNAERTKKVGIKKLPMEDQEAQSKIERPQMPADNLISQLEEKTLELEQLKESCLELEKQLEDASNSVEEAGTAQETAEKKSSELEQTCHRFQLVEQELQRKLEELEKSLSESTSMNDAARKQTEEYAKQLDELKKQQHEARAKDEEAVVSRLQEELAALKGRYVNREIELQQSEDKRVSTSTELDELQRTFESRQDEFETVKLTLSSNIDSLNAELTNERSRIENLEREKEELLADQSAAENKFMHTAEELRTLNDEIRRLQESRQREESIEQEAAKRGELKAEVDRLIEALSQKEVDLQQLSDEKRQVEDNYEKVSEEVTAMKQLIRNAEEKSDEVEKDRKRQKEEIAKYQQQVGSVEDECETLKSKEKSLIEKIRTLEEQSQEVEKANEKTTSDFSTLQSAYEELVSSNKETVQQNVSLQSQLQSLFLELDDLSRTKEEVSRNNELLVRERQEHTRSSIPAEKYEELKKEKVVVQNEVEQLRQKLDDERVETSGQFELLRKETNKLEAGNQELQKLMDETKQQNASLKNDVIVYRRETENIYGVLAKAQEKNKELELQIGKLEDELKSAQSRIQEQQSNDDSQGWDMDSDVFRDEFETLRTNNEKLLKELNESKELISSIRTDGPPLEYVQNIVYKYLMNKDTLGKGAVPLVRVIAAATGMDSHQTKNVISNEEKRVHSNNALRSAVNILQQR